MRTTLTLDDALAESLKEIAHRSGKPFKTVVNETFLAGLSQTQKLQARPYNLKCVAMGQPALVLNKATTVADDLEEQALIEKIEQSK